MLINNFSTHASTDMHTHAHTIFHFSRGRRKDSHWAHTFRIRIFRTHAQSLNVGSTCYHTFVILNNEQISHFTGNMHENSDTTFVCPNVSSEHMYEGNFTPGRFFAIFRVSNCSDFFWNFSGALPGDLPWTGTVQGHTVWPCRVQTTHFVCRHERQCVATTTRLSMIPPMLLLLLLPDAWSNMQPSNSCRRQVKEWCRYGGSYRTFLEPMPLDAHRSECGSTDSNLETLRLPAQTAGDQDVLGANWNIWTKWPDSWTRTAEWQLMNWVPQQASPAPVSTDFSRRTWKWLRSVQSLCHACYPRNKRSIMLLCANKIWRSSGETHHSLRKSSRWMNCGFHCLSQKPSKVPVNGCRKVVWDHRRLCAHAPQGKQCWFFFLTHWEWSISSLFHPGR